MSEILTFPIRSDKLAMQVQTKSHLLHRKTQFQTIDIFDTEVFGKVLLLDGHIQLTEFDERAYHEALVQIPLMSLGNPSAALVVGGGDGGVLRELCKCESLSRIDMIEIDKAVIEASEQYLPNLSAGSFQNSRVTVHVADAFDFVKKSLSQYDLIVIDSTDTYEEETGALSEMLFTREFYGDVRKILAPGGLVVTQADNLVFCPYSLASILELFQTVFPKVGSYQALVPSFGGYSAFAWGSVDHEMKGSFRKSDDLHYLTPETYSLAFSKLGF